MPTTTALYTSLKNTSGASKFFGFLPPHGRELSAGTTVTVLGQIQSYLLDGKRPNKRKLDAFEYALSNNLIEIIATPAVILYDATTANTKQLRVDNGSLGVIDPSYGSYSGAS